jgi:hypothetical protein
MTPKGINSTTQFALSLLGTILISFIGYKFIGAAIEGEDGLITWMIVFFGWPFMVAYLLVALLGLQLCYASIWNSNRIQAYFYAAGLLIVPFALSLITSAYFQTSLAVSLSLFVWSFFFFLVSPARFEASRK